MEIVINRMNIGKKLKEIRKNKGLTQKEVSQKLGIGVASLSNYENNIIDFPVSKLLLLLDFYNVEPINFLLNGEEYLCITNYSEVGKRKAYLLDILENKKYTSKTNKR